METKKVKMHVGCGGIIENGKCNTCGKRTDNFVKRFLKEPFIIKEDKNSIAEAHRRRIREGRDIRL